MPVLHKPESDDIGAVLQDVQVQANPLFHTEMNQMLSTDPLLSWISTG